MNVNRVPETAYVNGRVYTVDDKFSVASAFCTTGDRFLSVGTDDEILSLCDKSTRIVDLQQKTVLPGLIDSHLHINFVGAKQMELDLSGCSKAEILQKVKDAYARSEPGAWILGNGWFNDSWEFPSKEELDEVSPDLPVYLKRACMHASWGNSEAFRRAGIGEDTPDPVGGEYLRKQDGTLLGIVTDQAQAPFDNAIPSYTKEQLQQCVLLAQEGFFKAGLTTVHDAGTDGETLKAWKELYETKQLKLRIYAVMRVPGRPTYEELYQGAQMYFKNGIQIGMYGNRLTARGFKLSCDGSLGARSAWMLQAYSDRLGHCGNGKFTDEQLYTLLYDARLAGFQPLCHAIGDATNRQVLDVYERILKELPSRDHRFRIEHAQVLSPEDIPRFSRLGVIPTEQTVFLRSDKEVAETRIGAERMKGAYAWQTLIQAGNCPPNGSDAPVETFNPFIGLSCAVLRTDEQGRPNGGWYPAEAMTREQALRSYTIWGAYAGFEENLKGSIEPGKLADFIVIDKDYMKCREEEIKDIRVLKTVLGGETVYTADLP